MIKTNSTNILIFNKFYKIFFSRNYLSQEIYAYRNAKKNKMYSNFVHPIKSFFLGYYSEKGFKIDDKKFVSITLNNLSLNEKNFISADQLINSDLLKKKLDINIYEHLNLISKLKVPLTGAHGDLHNDNIIFNKKKELKFIDWRNYRDRNTFIYDLLHLKIRDFCLKLNRSWTEVILDKTLDLNCYVSKEFSNQKFILLIFYSLMTIDLELSLNQNNLEKIKKFKHHLKSILIK